MGPDADAVAHGIRGWHDLHADLDLTGTEVVARAVRLAGIAEDRIVTALDDFGLTFHGYSVLAVLRTARTEAGGLRGTEIAERSHLSSGGLTNLLHRLERDGLVQRGADPRDGRATVVRLTDRGREVADAAVRRVAAQERALVANLPPRDRERLAKLLATLLSAVE